MHLRRFSICPERFPTTEDYPFNLPLLQAGGAVPLPTPVTFFVGENGSGKSTLLHGLARRCGVHIWQERERLRAQPNAWERWLHLALDLDWTAGKVPGSLFASDLFQDFARLWDEWAATTPELLDYVGGQSLLTQSHGQSLMAFFRSRYRIRGLYFLDEPETALSPRTQVELLHLLRDYGAAGEAQFVVATHSPILLACPGATIYSFDTVPVQPVAYEDTDHVRLYRQFLADPQAAAADR